MIPQEKRKGNTNTKHQSPHLPLISTKTKLCFLCLHIVLGLVQNLYKCRRHTDVKKLDYVYYV